MMAVLRVVLVAGFVTLLLAVTSVKAQSPRQGRGLAALAADYEIATDINYVGGDNRAQTLDVIVPKAIEDGQKLPVVVHIHGGGWKGGSKQGGLSMLHGMTGLKGIAGVSINYRLSGEAQWPAQIHDCKAAIRWVKANAEKYHFDPEKIVVWGTSAGGHLVAMLGVTGPDDGLEGELGSHLDQNSKVAGVINFYGPTDFVLRNIPGERGDVTNPNSSVSQLLGKVDDVEAALEGISPVTYASQGDAPVLNAFGTEDKLVALRQATRLDEALTAKEVPCCTITVEGAGHGFKDIEAIKPAFNAFVEHIVRGREFDFADQHLRPERVRTGSERQ